MLNAPKTNGCAPGGPKWSISLQLLLLLLIISTLGSCIQSMNKESILFHIQGLGYMVEGSYPIKTEKGASTKPVVGMENVL